jgi:CheY-like chemotaxis protein
MSVLAYASHVPVSQAHIAPCFRCRQPFDCLSAELCDCIARERTFVCPHCGCCACGASHRQRNAFWITAPPSLWERRRKEESDGVARLQSLDPRLLPRPLALIVDDETLVLTVADRTLRAMGFTTLITTKPEEASAIAMATVPDLLLTDALMPRMDGRDLCLNLKSTEDLASMKVIVMSAVYRRAAYRNEAYKRFRVDEYLDKPINPAVLREVIGRLMPRSMRTIPVRAIRSSPPERRPDED